MLNFSAFKKLGADLLKPAPLKPEARPLDFSAFQPKKPYETPKADISGGIKKLIAGKGVVSLFKKEPAPITYREALQQGYSRLREQFSIADIRTPEGKEKMTSLALSFMTIGDITSVGNKIPKGKVINIVGKTKDLAIRKIRNVFNEIAKTNNTQIIVKSLQKEIGGDTKALTEIAGKLKNITEVKDVAQVIKNNSNLDIKIPAEPIPVEPTKPVGFGEVKKEIIPISKEELAKTKNLITENTQLQPKGEIFKYTEHAVRYNKETKTFTDLPPREKSIFRKKPFDGVPEDILEKIKVGGGARLDKTELSRLGQSLSDLGYANENTGLVVKSYSGKDIILGTTKGEDFGIEYIVAGINKRTGKLETVRLHATPMTNDDIIGRTTKTLKDLSDVGEDLKLKLPEIKPTPTKSPLTAEARKYETADEMIRADFQKRIIAGQDLGKEIGKKVNPDGTITLYHGTSKQSASDILSSGKFNEGAYFSVNKRGVQYGDSPLDVAKRKFGKEGTVIEIKVDARDFESVASGVEVYSPYSLVKENGIWQSSKIKTKSQLKQIWEEARGVKKIDTKKDVRVPTADITPTKAPQLPRKQLLEPVSKRVPLREDVSLKKTIPQQEKLHKSLTENGRVLVNEKGEQVFPKPTKENPTPLENPIILEMKKGIAEEKQLKIIEKALDGVSKKHGHTEIIIENLKKKGVSQEQINNIYLENGQRLVDTVKVKREANGVLSATITKDTLKEIKTNFTLDTITKKWIPTKTAMQKMKEAGKTVKDVPLEYYELPQIFFDRTGLRTQFYDPIREAERNAQDMKTAIFKQFEKVGLMKEGGHFTADRFTLSKKEAENVGEYFLTRQEKGGKINLSDLTTKEKKFVEVFDNVIKESEERFYKVAELNGKSPGKIKNYAPIMTNEDYKLAQEIGDMDFIFRKHPAFFSLKQREIKVPFEMYELDYRKVASRWIDQVANFNHLGEVGVEVKYLANSSEFKELVGDKVYQTTNKWLQNKFNPQVLSTMEKGGRFLRQKTSVASLGLNLASVVKQYLSIVPLTIIEKAPPKLTSQFAKHFGIKVSDLASIKERKGNVSIMDMQQGFNRAVVGALTQEDKRVAQMGLNSLLDVNYKKILKETNSKDLSPEMQAKVIKQAQDTLDIWMGGMTTSQLPVAFRTELGKLLNMFIYPLTSQLNGFIYTVAKAKGISKAEKLAEVLVSALIIAYMEQVITNLSPEWSDTEEMTVDTFSSLAGNIPIISQVVFAIRTDQPISPSPIFSSIGRVAQQISKSTKDQASAGDVILAISEMFGLPKQLRRTIDGVTIVKEGGLRDKNGKLLVPVKGEWEYIRAFLRGKYGTIATQDWIRNIGIPKEQRKWFVPEVEFFQNGDYDRKEELYKSFDKETQDELYAELSEGQQKKLDKALRTPPKTLEHKKRLFREKIKKALEDGTMTQKEAVEKAKEFKEAVERLSK